MIRNYHRWHSPNLNRDMELLEFGHGGFPIVVFPTSKGRFFEYEDRGMIASIAPQIEQGEYHLFCVDSVDAESWYNRSIHPHHRVMRHNQYDDYIFHEVATLALAKEGRTQIGVTGCSFGGFHAVNFALKHPDLVSACVSMSGAYDMTYFMPHYTGEDFYLNQPLQYLPNLNDGWYWNHYQKMKLVLATGEWDICLDDNLRLSDILSAKSIPHLLDIWGDGTGHDWSYWKQMMQKFF